jgi:hypothetical protein
VKNLLFLLLFLNFHWNSYSQFKNDFNCGISIAHSYGFLITHYPHMKPLAKGPVRSYEVAMSLQTNGNKEWHTKHNFPVIHINYAFFDFSNREQIGFVHTLMPTMSLKINRSKIFYNNIVVGIGVGYFESPHDRITNNKNAAIGSHINGSVRIGTEIGFNLNNKMRIGASIIFNHWSNGSMKVPNLGMNVPSLMLRADYFFNDNDNENKRQPKEKFEKKPIDLILIASIGSKQVEPLGSGNFAIATLQLDALKAISYKNSLGIGLDLFYNEGIRQMMSNANQEFSSINYFRSGIHLSHQFRVGRIATLFNLGTYFFKKDKLDKFLYNRIGFRYFLNEKVHFNLSLKSHYFVADHFEFGVGFKIK